MEKKTVTLEMWQEFVKNNCDVSYSLAVVMAILEMWEMGGADTKEEATKLLDRTSVVSEFSGFQAEMVISYVIKGEPDGWLDKNMQEISQESGNEPLSVDE